MLVFVSDVHLTKPHTKKYEAFLSLLKKSRDDENVEELFLCGDIFDLWIGHKNFFFKKHEELIGLLKEIAKKKKVHVFEGNHDFQFKSSWWKKHSIEIHKEEYEFEYQGKNIFVCHGDLLNKKDYGYRLLRWFFRSRVAKFLVLLLPGFILNFIGETLSSTESKTSRNYENTSKKVFLEKWKVWIEDLRSNKKFDVFICGHFHVRFIENVGGMETFNLGSWLGGDIYKYLSYDGKSSEFREV